MADELGVADDTKGTLVISASGIEVTGFETGPQLGAKVQSWIGGGENLPVTAEQISEALGEEQLAAFAAKAGTTPQVAATELAEQLPVLVDKLSPHGQISDDPQVVAPVVRSSGPLVGELLNLDIEVTGTLILLPVGVRG